MRPILDLDTFTLDIDTFTPNIDTFTPVVDYNNLSKQLATGYN